MEKIKVLHRVSSAGVGGMEKYVFNNYRYIDRERIQFDLLSRNVNLANDEEVCRMRMGVQIFQNTENTDREMFIKEINEILDVGYDAIHMNTSFWAGYLIEELAIQRGIPNVIVHAHSTGIDCIDIQKRKQYEAMHEFYKSKFGRQYATYYCACSWKAADFLFGDRIPREEIHILRNAIELEKYTFNQSIRNLKRQELGIDNEFVIGTVGRFSYQKNQRFLIDVFEKVHKRNPRTKLMLVGMGELENELREQVQQKSLEDSTFILIDRDDVNELMQAMDLFVLPSRFEGLPIVGVEAQASGLPCVISKAVTSELDITNNVTFLDLDEEIWVLQILNKISCMEDRKNTYAQLSDAGYNITLAAKELEKIYINE